MENRTCFKCKAPISDASEDAIKDEPVEVDVEFADEVADDKIGEEQNSEEEGAAEPLMGFAYPLQTDT